MNMKKILVLALAAMLLVVVSVAGTMAYLTAKSGEVTNTFTTANITIELKEHKLNTDGKTIDETTEVTENKGYKMIPGDTLVKDPFVRVMAGSEPCYVFVKVEKSENFDQFMTYNHNASDWTPVTNYDGWYYYNKEVDAFEEDVITTSVLSSTNAVVVKESVTEADFTADDYVDPTLTFVAYAIQSANTESPAAAFADFYAQKFPTND